MIEGGCPNPTCINKNTGFEIDEFSMYCPACGTLLVPYPKQEEDEEDAKET